MENFVHSFTGLVHVLTSIAAMIIGMLVLVIKKGTRTHRSLGYFYFYLMLTLNGTAFMLYDLFGTFGPFHVAALFSLATLLLGIIPVLSRKPKSKWLMLHFTFMYYSIIGLYAAFASETLTRIPKSPFFTMVILATITITVIGVIIYNRMKSQWIKEFASSEK